MLWKIKKTWVAFVLAAALLCLCGCGTDDINISGYAGEEIVLAGLAEEDVVITIRDMKAMDCVTVRTESTSDKIGKVRATGTTLETVLAQQGIALEDVRKVTFHGADDYAYSLNADYISEHDIILAFGIDGEPLDEENAPCRIIIPKSDSAYWLRLLDRIEFELD